MAMIKIRGYDINLIPITSTHDRRALQFKNKIILNLRKIDLTPDDIEIELERIAVKKAPASAIWYLQGHRLYYSYSSANSFVDNLFIVNKIIELEINSLLNGLKTLEEFISGFTEDDDVEEKRKEARKIIGVSEDCLDMEEINQKYKVLAKKYHPDMPNGDLIEFQKINKAHKLLKRELV
ncbi:MAG: J domain-containing protein [Nanoarchaeota archaeon]|nr:J domain-containing protein [Nanoarchaeota archaeon]